MLVKFLDADGGNPIFETEKADISTFINMIKTVDKINIYYHKDCYWSGTLHELVYDVTDEDGIPNECLIVYVSDFRDNL